MSLAMQMRSRGAIDSLQQDWITREFLESSRTQANFIFVLGMMLLCQYYKEFVHDDIPFILSLVANGRVTVLLMML